MPLAKRIVLEWRTDTDSKMAKEYKWYCPECDRVYERQTDAQVCCMESKEKLHWFTEDMEPTQIPVGIRHGGEFIAFEYSSTTVDNPDDTRYTTVSGDVVVFAEGGYHRTHFIIPKMEQRDYVASTVSTFCYIDQAFEEWWETAKDDYRSVEAERYHNLKWNSLIKWIDKYLELKIIPSHQIGCMVETRQQYKDFPAKDILYTLKALGEKANHFYCAERDHFPGPLKKYHDYAMNNLVWHVASFVQTDYTSFTDLVTRLTELLS